MQQSSALNVAAWMLAGVVLQLCVQVLDIWDEL